ncbi:MAG: ATP-binding protein [Lachnospiraceae bacterium]|nr:ATP-binding protein [Lachnospiraceae bacterium]
MELKAEDVFRPGAFPEYTYISRKSAVSNLPYEFRLNQAIKVSGFLTSLVGPSKMGKTILCEKVIGFDRIVEISGSDFNGDIDFWKLAATKAGLSYEGQFSSEHTIIDTQDKYGKKERYSLTKDKIIDYYTKENLVLVIDDFHYAPQEKRILVAQQLKDAIRRGFKAIVVSLPHRADEAIRQNADLSGRLSLINMEPWQVEDLKEIAKVGFAKLNIKIEDKVAQMIAVESLSSPQLMQYICLNICTILEMGALEKDVVNVELLETAYRYTTANFEYGDVVTLMKKGPSTRGKNRNQFVAKDGKSYDLYELIVKSIAENPPMMKLDFETIRERINELIVDTCKKPTQQGMKESLTKLQELLNEREDIFKVLDWKEGILYILDPLFLFYLRWGGDGDKNVF